jgi:hypothetical protein
MCRVRAFTDKQQSKAKGNTPESAADNKTTRSPEEEEIGSVLGEQITRAIRVADIDLEVPIGKAR